MARFMLRRKKKWLTIISGVIIRVLGIFSFFFFLKEICPKSNPYLSLKMYVPSVPIPIMGEEKKRNFFCSSVFSFVVVVSFLLDF